ncbi:MAG: TylF/MycF/NovP-related O-methyltransferase [Planctomycetaceae bacterium]
MRSLLCLQYLNEVRKLPGDVIELGVAYGTTSLTLALWMEENTPLKTLFACDTFTGLPTAEGDLQAGECNYGSAFQRTLHQLPINNVKVVKGLIEETLPTQLADKRFCFAWLDMDLYSPTSFAAKWLRERMTPGGIIGFHDYGFQRCPGIAKVVDSEIDTVDFQWIGVDHNCAFLRRR